MWLQVVTNEYFDPVGRFNQAAWAKQLLSTLQARPVRPAPSHGSAAGRVRLGLWL